MSFFKSVSTVSLFTFLSRVTGLVRDLFMAAMFGSSAMTDAFNVAFRIPNLFRRLFAEGAFSQAFVPVLAATRAKHGEMRTKVLVDHVASVLFWILLGFSFLGILGAPLLVWVLASGFDKTPDAFNAATVMTRWMFPYIACMSLVALSAGILNTWERYKVPAATPILLNISMIAAAVLLAPQFKKWNIEPIYAMAVGVMLGGVLQLAIQIPVLRRMHFLPRIATSSQLLRESWQDIDVRRILKLMGPAILGVGVAQISLIINTQIASHLQAGSVTWLFYADRLMEFPTALLGVALGVVLTPALSAARMADDQSKYSQILDWGLRIVVLFALPCAVGLIFFAKPLVSTLFHYGKLSVNDVQQISVALVGYGIGLLGMVAIKVLASGYFARQNMRTPVKVAIVVLIATQVMNVFLVPRFAHVGLALSIGLGALFNAAWLLLGLRRNGYFQPESGWWRLIFQVLAGLIALAIFLFFVNHYVDWLALQEKPVLRIGLMLLSLLLSAVIYFGILLLSRCDIRVVLRR